MSPRDHPSSTFHSSSLWGVTGTLTSSACPELTSHHPPCLAGWDGLGLGHGQVRARRKEKHISWRVRPGLAPGCCQAQMPAAALRSGVGATCSWGIEALREAAYW